MTITSGGLLGLCFAAVFSCVILPWSMAIAYRRRRTPNTPRKPKKVVENANNYRRYTEYTSLIICWAAAISAYIAVLDRAVNHPSFMGPKGSDSRNIRFQVLAFVRTGFAIIHLPLMTAVLAATVPYWTMAKRDPRLASETNPSRPTDEADGLERPTRVSQLFYLADRSWSGLIGWITTSMYGWKEGGFSFPWTLLAMIAALSYAGFPLLSLAYVSSSTQYWESGDMPATVRLGGIDSPYSSVFEAMHDRNKWMKSEGFLNTTLSSNLTGFNSSTADRVPFSGIANQSVSFPWADNQTVFTLSPNTTGNKQLPLVGIRAFASCGLQNFSIADLIPVDSNGTTLVRNLNFDNVDPDTNIGSPYKLRCANDCSNVRNSSAMACSTQSSIVNLTHFEYKDQSGYLDGGSEFDTYFSFSNVGPTSQSQTLSCIQQESSDLQSVATILLAVQGPNASTQIANCNMSVTYLRPTINTLIGSYIDSTGSSSTDIILDATPVELLNLSMASFVNFFHEGPPTLTYQPVNNASIGNCYLPPISTGFDWISDWKPPCGSNPYDPPITNATTPATLLTGLPNYAAFVSGVSSFDERVFLGPLASLINEPSFFENGTVVGVAFKTEPGLVYGKVPAVLAVLVLAIPVLCAIALSVITITQRRWTASLDAFSMFKLGADWRDNVENQKLVSLGKANSHVREIPGTVIVNPETGVVELAHPPKRRRLSRNTRRPGWLQDYAAPQNVANPEK
ncbi:MAG: hypothetical protein Q9161_008187 [Pseudevernia consocians]